MDKTSQILNKYSNLFYNHKGKLEAIKKKYSHITTVLEEIGSLIDNLENLFQLLPIVIKALAKAKKISTFVDEIVKLVKELHHMT